MMEGMEEGEKGNQLLGMQMKRVRRREKEVERQNWSLN
jgi:hypothetical protein